MAGGPYGSEAPPVRGSTPPSRRSSRGDLGHSGSIKLPPLAPRPPSADDVVEARKHLGLLKARMGQRGVAPRGPAQGGSSNHRAGSSSPSGRPRSSSRPREARTRSVPPKAPAREDAAAAANLYGGAPSGGGAPSSGVQNSPPGTAQRATVQTYSAPPAAAAPPSGPSMSSEYPPGYDFSSIPGAEDGGPVAPMIKCEDCGRSFNEKAMEKHANVCKKVNQKRAKFDSASNRLGELEREAKQLEENAKQTEKQSNKANKSKKGSDATDEKDSGKPMPKWKKESLAFRQQMLAAKADAGDADAAVKVAAVNKELDKAGAQPDPDKTQCPHCGRTFNKDSAERHINICLKTFGTKAGRLVRGGGSNGQGNAKVGGESGGAAAGGRSVPASGRAVPQRAAAAAAPPVEEVGRTALGNAAAKAQAANAGRPGGGVPRQPSGGYSSGQPASAGSAPTAARRSRSTGGGAARR